ncbi:RING finger protein 215 isoform X4 [Microcaecilia unicolor]|uniref:RING finger protein 215 isoform X4 n=1 Tax=Microcaecilia unicolor TaxID=1415580 RepID=A0A6P7ZEX5_9AMPH|nr:RING finger protein 215 isoform X4 [Microcaecilia unicolor]
MGRPLLCFSLLLGQIVSLCLGTAGKAGAWVEVFLQEPEPHATGSPYILQGALLDPQGSDPVGQGSTAGLAKEQNPSQQEVEGSLILVGDSEPEVEEEDSWIGVFLVGEEQGEIQRGSKEESFTAAVVSKMKRALVLGASALLILALNQNAIREGVTLTLWSTCGRSRSGLYGEWQGVICTGETSSQVQKYLQQLWNTILLVALILCTGLVVQAQRQSRHHQPGEDPELNLKQHILQRLSALKTRRYHPSKHRKSQSPEIETCAVCLDQFHRNQCLRVLPCLHEFHRDCVDPWLLLQHTCPLCKYNILGHNNENVFNETVLA